MSIEATFGEHRAVFEESAAELVPNLTALSKRAIDCLRGGGKLIVCGNGGSAADAQHFVAELVGRYELERPGLPAIALTTDTSVLTAVGNDYGFEEVFARQVQALAAEGDLFVGISTSGSSPNVVKAAARARDAGCVTAALTGATGGELLRTTDICLRVPSKKVARIQEIHELCLHALAEAIDFAWSGA